MRERKFAVIVGSGFSGSLLAWILQRQGKDVVLIDRGTHPRFAIGESSTPTADFLLAHLSDRWNLPSLAPFACWGTWKEKVPQVRCGKKRGFSYYAHRAGQDYTDDAIHSRSLLVAASCEDRWSDTQWYRRDVDQHWFQCAIEAGVQAFERTAIQTAEWDASTQLWHVQAQGEREAWRGSCDWLIDASGGGAALAAWTGQKQDDAWMRTRTGAVFAHFNNLPSFVEDYYDKGLRTQDPFHGDDAAQHHVVEDGWQWQIRFDHGVTSCGWVLPEQRLAKVCKEQDLHSWWVDQNARYPTLHKMLQQAKIDPEAGSIRIQHRMSRCLDRAAGKRWIAVPTAYGFVDPLHSSGIAHALSGVARIAELLLCSEHRWDESCLNYDRQLRSELAWIDTLVSGCYACLPSFDRFVGFSAFYFVAAIGFEKQLAADPIVWPLGFMQADDDQLRSVAEDFWHRASLERAESERDDPWMRSLRERLQPWNQVGLLEAERGNRLAHTVAPKYAMIAVGSRPPVAG
ncbi:MAG: tryptophan 7-halogenase [Pirellulales bacterium]